MLEMMPGIIFNRSRIEMSQTRDTSRSGLVNLKANSNAFNRKSYHMESHIDLEKF